MLESLIGLLLYTRRAAAFGNFYIHFLIYSLNYSLISDKDIVELHPWATETLEWWFHWATHGSPGVLIKTMIPRNAKVTITTDASMCGFGGIIHVAAEDHHPSTTHVFSHELPPTLQKRLYNTPENLGKEDPGTFLYINDLELTASILGILLTFQLLGSVRFGDTAVNSVSDNLSTVAWVDNQGTTSIRAMRSLQLLTADGPFNLPQHHSRGSYIPGPMNLVPDFLSRGFNSSDKVHQSVPSVSGSLIPELPWNNKGDLLKHIRTQYPFSHPPAQLSQATWITASTQTLSKLYSPLLSTVVTRPSPKSKSRRAAAVRGTSHGICRDIIENIPEPILR